MLWYVIILLVSRCLCGYSCLLLLCLLLIPVSVLKKKEKHFFYARLGMQPSGRNCNPAPDSVFPKLTFQPVFLSGGVFFSQTPVWEKFALPESILPQVLVNLVSCKIGSLGHFCTSIKTIMGYMFAFRVNPSGSEIYEMRGWWTGGGGEHVRGSEKPSAGADKRSYYRKQSEELFPNIHRPTEEYAKRGSKKGYF